MNSMTFKKLIRRHPVASYFVLTYAVSWTGAFAVVAPKLVLRQPIPVTDGILMFPLMLLGPSVAGIALTRVLDGKAGVGQLFRRIGRLAVPARWYALLLVPPATIFAVLCLLAKYDSPIYAHGTFWLGMTFGILAAFFEEIGWMGFAFPRMARSGSALKEAVILGLLWGCWHIPVVNYLGTDVPHGRYWLPYFLAFVAVMTAMRVLIAWLYVNTKSLALVQLLHMSSTGSLVVLSPPHVSAAQEVLWYAVYAAALWLIVAVIARIFGKTLVRGFEDWRGRQAATPD